MGLWKRRRGRVEYLTPAQMLETLALLRMRALLAHGAVWVAADRGASAALDLCCVGALEGGPSTAAWVAGLVGATRSTPDALAGATADGGGTTGDNDNAAAAAAAPTQLAGAAEGGAVSAARLRAVRLAPEEALFLAHVLSPSLTAFELVEEIPSAEPTARPLSLDELWRWCCRAGGGGASGNSAPAPAATIPPPPTTDDPLIAATIGREGRGDGQPQSPTLPCPFPYRYAAYCHLRAKGWLPRGGLLYGADFVLYGLHPALVHSEYVAVVLPLERRGEDEDQDEGAGASGPGAAAALAPPATAAAVAAAAPRPPPQANGATVSTSIPSPTLNPLRPKRGWWAEAPLAALRWVDAQIAQRLARQVFKQLLLVHVALPCGSSSSSSPEDLGPDGVLKRGAVRETVARRWVPPAGGGVAQALADAAVAAGAGLEPADDD
jgi:hypothetical protein